MNVLFCTDGKYAQRGGVTNYIQLLFSHFDRQCVIPFDWNLWTGMAFLRVSNPNTGIRLYRKLKIIQTLLTFRRLIRKGKIDIVHLNPSLVPNALQRDIAFARRCASVGVPFVVFFRGWDREYEELLDASPRKRKQLVDSFGVASKIIVLASEFKDRLITWGFDARRIILETTAVDDRLLVGSQMDRMARLDSEDKFNILFLSRIERAKGVYEAVEAFWILKQKYPYVSMTIAGDGPELPRVKQYVARKAISGVRYLGWADRDKKRSAYLDAALYLFPTYHGEGMPNSVLEAMAFGLPVITRPVGGLADFFEDGRMGFISDSKAPQTFASKCELLIQNTELRKEIGNYNREYAKGRFLASRVARRIQSIYEEVLRNPK